MIRNIPRQQIKLATNLLWILFMLIAGYFIYTDLPGKLPSFAEFNFFMAIIGLLAGVLASMPSAWITNNYFFREYKKSTLAISFVLTFLPAIGKYIPGKAWAVLTFMLQAKTLAEISAKSSAGFQIYFHLIGLISTSLFLCAGLGILYFVDQSDKYSQFLIGVLVVLFVSILATIITLRYFRTSEHNTSNKSIAMHILAISMQKFLRGIALIIFLESWLPLQGNWILILFSFVAAMQAGVLAIFAPAGIGVTEATYVYFLSGPLTLEIAITIAILARLWQTCLDFLLAGIGFVLNNYLSSQRITTYSR